MNGEGTDRYGTGSGMAETMNEDKAATEGMVFYAGKGVPGLSRAENL